MSHWLGVQDQLRRPPKPIPKLERHFVTAGPKPKEVGARASQPHHLKPITHPQEPIMVTKKPYTYLSICMGREEPTLFTSSFSFMLWLPSEQSSIPRCLGGPSMAKLENPNTGSHRIFLFCFLFHHSLQQSRDRPKCFPKPG